MLGRNNYLGVKRYLNYLKRLGNELKQRVRFTSQLTLPEFFVVNGNFSACCLLVGARLAALGTCWFFSKWVLIASCVLRDLSFAWIQTLCFQNDCISLPFSECGFIGYSVLKYQNVLGYLLVEKNFRQFSADFHGLSEDHANIFDRFPNVAKDCWGRSTKVLMIIKAV